MTHLALVPPPSPWTRAAPAGELRIRSDTLADGTRVVLVEGDVDVHTAPDLGTCLAGALGRTGPIVIDLSMCTFIDSAGVKVLVRANKRLRRSGRRLELVIPETCLLPPFELCGLRDLFVIRTSLTSALAPPVESWAQEARRRVAIRCANERLERSCIGLGAVAHERFYFICECGDRSCGALLQLSVAEYEAVREHAARFAIAPNHENPEVERVVRQNGRFAIVETVTGLLSKPARETNPRWQRGGPW